MANIARFTGEYAFLSNFHPSIITFEGMAYPTVEHAYQAAKTLDSDIRQEISLLSTPGKAKRAGLKLERREDWFRVNMVIMHYLLRKKFQIPELKQKLLNTKDASLEEGNNWGDKYWGTVNGEGENHLGLLLMQVRDELHNL